jgi:hypothetical protein
MVAWMKRIWLHVFSVSRVWRKKQVAWANREVRVAVTPYTMDSLPSTGKPGDTLTPWAETSTPCVIVRPLANPI